MSLNDKAAAALKREIRRAFPERPASDPGHDRLAKALGGYGWSYTSTGNGAFITIHAPDERTLLLQGEDARKFLDQEADTNDSFTIADLCASYADAFDAPHDRLAAALSDTARHTPGEWVVCDSVITNESGSAVIAKVANSADSHLVWQCSTASFENAANARLIAAAPCLLAALKAAAECIETGDLHGDANRVTAAARAAIARAEGGAA